MLDMEVLKKKISTFRDANGRVSISDNSLLMEILVSWEQHKGPMLDFYRTLGVSAKGMASIIGRAKKLRREGHFPAEEFKEIKIGEAGVGAVSSLMGCNVIELSWENGRLIRFGQVEQLIDFLKKAA